MEKTKRSGGEEMSENDNENRVPGTDAPEEIPESAAARIMHALGEDEEQRPPIEVEHVGFFENFWYHHKWKTIVISFLVVLTVICMVQMGTQDQADVYVMYAGPGYLTPNEARSALDAMKQVMDDYNGDGEKGILLADFNYLNEAQIAAKEAQAEAEGVDFIFDNYGNSSVYEQYELEVIAGESVIYILDPDLYANVKKAGGLLTLEEVLGETPACAVDDYGVRLADTNFAQYYSAMHVFPEDSILCIRRVSTMSVFKGQKKTERLHAYHVELFRSILSFEFPEGYTPAQSETQN